MIKLKTITENILYDVCALSNTLEKPQSDMIAHNVWSIALGGVAENTWMRAIYYNKILIGFLMIQEEKSVKTILEEKWFLWRFMIAKPYQGKGYGKETIQLIIDLAKSLRVPKITTCCFEGEGSPKEFYKKLGFAETGGRLKDGEIVLSLDLV